MPYIEFPSNLTVKEFSLDDGGIWEALLTNRLSLATRISAIDIKRILHIYGLTDNLPCVDYAELASLENPDNFLLFIDEDTFSIVVSSRDPLKLQVSGSRELNEDEIRRLEAAFAPETPDISPVTICTPLAALHNQVSALTQAPAGNIPLVEFHAARSESEWMTCFYQHMLTHLSLAPALYDTRQHELKRRCSAVPNSDGVYQLTEAGIREILSGLEVSPIPPLEQEVDLPLALRGVLDDYRPGMTTGVIANVGVETSSHHVFAFLKALSVKVEEHQLKTISFSASDGDYKQVRQGINAFLFAGYAFPAKSIRIEITPDTDLKVLAHELCSLYERLNLAELNELALDFVDAHMNDYDLTELEAFFKRVESGAHPFDITLNGYIRTKFQYRLDTCVGEAKRVHHAARVLDGAEEAIQRRRVEASSVVRKRRGKAVEIDVDFTEELAQNMQVAMDESMEEAFELEQMNAASDTERVKTYNLDEIIEELTAYKPSELRLHLPYSHRFLTVYEVKRLWSMLTGGMPIRWAGGSQEFAPSGPHKASDITQYETGLSTTVFSRISEPALIEILTHRQAFEDGWNVEALPSGFYLDENRELHFDSTRQEKSREAIYYKATNKAPNILTSPVALDALLEALSKQTENPQAAASAKALKAILLFQERFYRKEFLEQVVNKLPLLLKLSPEQIKELVKTCSETRKDDFNPLVFQYFIENIELLATLSENGLRHESDDLVVRHFMSEYIDVDVLRRCKAFEKELDSLAIRVSELGDDCLSLESQIEALGDDNEEERQRLQEELAENRERLRELSLEQVQLVEANIEITKQYDKDSKHALACYRKLQDLALAIKNHKAPTHPLTLLIAENEQLASDIGALTRSDKALDKLLTLYYQFGETGISRLYEVYQSQPEFVKEIIEAYYFESDAPLDELLESSKVIGMLRTIDDSYRDDEKAWFKALVKAHLRHNPQTPLFMLVTAFNEFRTQFRSEYEKEGGLARLDEGDFAQVDDMVVSLSRIKSMKEKVDKRNQSLFWRSLPKLDLRAGGAHLAMLADKSALTVVTPEMRITPSAAKLKKSSGRGGNTASYNPGYFIQRVAQIAGDNEAAMQLFHQGVPPGSELREMFYRFVASRRFKYNLETFYKPLLDEIDNNFPEDWDYADKLKLYKVIALATTTISEEKSAYSTEEEALKVWVELFNDIKGNKVPDYIPIVGGTHIGKEVINSLTTNLTVIPDTFTCDLLIRKLMSRVSVRAALSPRKTSTFFKAQRELLKRLNTVLLNQQQGGDKELAAGETILAGLSCSLSISGVADDVEPGPLERFIEQIELVQGLMDYQSSFALENLSPQDVSDIVTLIDETKKDREEEEKALKHRVKELESELKKLRAGQDNSHLNQSIRAIRSALGAKKRELSLLQQNQAIYQKIKDLNKRGEAYKKALLTVEEVIVINELFRSSGKESKLPKSGHTRLNVGDKSFRGEIPFQILKEDVLPDMMLMVGFIDTKDANYLQKTRTLTDLALDVYYKHRSVYMKDVEPRGNKLDDLLFRTLRKVINIGFNQIDKVDGHYPSYDELHAFFKAFNEGIEAVVNKYNDGSIEDREVFHDELIKAGFGALEAELGRYFKSGLLQSICDDLTSDKIIKAKLDKLFLPEESDERQAFELFLSKVSAANRDQKLQLIRFYETLRFAVSKQDKAGASQTLITLLTDLSEEGVLKDEAGEPLKPDIIIELLKSLNSRAKLADFNSFCKLSKAAFDGKLPNGALLKAKVFVADCRPVIIRDIKSLSVLFRKQLALQLLEKESAATASAPIGNAITFSGQEALARLNAIVTGLNESSSVDELTDALGFIDEISETLKLAGDAYCPLFDADGAEALSLVEAAKASIRSRIDAVSEHAQKPQKTSALYQEVSLKLKDIARSVDTFDSVKLGEVKQTLAILKRRAEALSQPLLAEYLTTLVQVVATKQAALSAQQEQAQQLAEIERQNADIDILYRDVDSFLRALQENIDKQGESLETYKQEQAKLVSALIERANDLGQGELKNWLTNNIQQKLSGTLETARVGGWGLLSQFTWNYAANFKSKRPKSLEPTYKSPTTPTAPELISSHFHADLPEQQEVAAESQPWGRSALDELASAIGDITSRRQTYSGVLSEVYSLLDTLCVHFPGTERQVKRLADVLVRTDKPLSTDETTDLQLGRFYQRLQLMIEAINRCRLLNADQTPSEQTRQNTDIMRALCEHVLPTKSHEGMLEDFFRLITTEPYRSMLPVDQAKLLQVMTVYLNAGQQFEMGKFLDLVTRFKDHGQLSLLWDIFAEPPCPSIDKVNSFLPVEGPIFRKPVYLMLANYRLQPAPRETMNGFDLALAKQKQAGLFFQGGFAFDVSDGGDLDKIYNETIACQSQPNAELLRLFRTFQDKAFPMGKEDAAKYLAITAELMYRAKAREGGPGSSFEINTTQYMALYAMLTSGRHSMSQIATGEGKTRITMLMAAMQYGLGQTVDLVTSDVALATRDYIEYQGFFGMLGAKTSLITASSNIGDYHLDGGIHFSDAGNLSLFRNKALYKGRYEQTINQDASKRCLLLDEADTTMLDGYRTRYNFSDKASKLIENMEWVYPYLVHYFEDIDEESAKTATKASFIEWVSSQPLPSGFVEADREAQLAQLKLLSDTDINNWFSAVDSAKGLKFGVHYTINTSQALRQGADGVLYREATLMLNNKPETNAKYSFGVQQCLHARLNFFLQNRERVPDELAPLLEKVDDQTRFFIDLEKQIVVSSTSGNLLEDYSDGSLLALTGTSGTSLHHAEIAERYGVNGEMKFITVPTHRECQRISKGYEVAKDNGSQIKVLAERVIEAQRKNQPILLICEHDEESADLIEKLTAEVSRLLRAEGVDEQEITDLLAKFSLVSAEMSNEEVASYVDKKAGLPKQVTITTGRLGRGTDIKLKNGAETHGLSVLITHIPESRDGRQYEGRAARFGAQGCAEYVLDLKREKRRFEGSIFLQEGHYQYGDETITLPQKLKDVANQAERLLKLDNGRYIRQYRDFFFLKLKSASHGESIEYLDVKWLDFQRQSDLLWKEAIADILDASGDNVVDEIDELLQKYQRNIQEKWQNLFGDDMREWLADGNAAGQQLNEPKMELSTAIIKAIKFMQRPLPRIIATAQDEDELTIGPYRGEDFEKPLGVYVAGEPFNDRSETQSVTLYAPNTPDKSRRRSLWSDIKAWWRGDINFRELRTREIDTRTRTLTTLPNGQTVFTARNVERRYPDSNVRRETFEEDMKTRWQQAERDYYKQQSIDKFDALLAEMEGREREQTAALERLSDHRDDVEVVAEEVLEPQAEVNLAAELKEQISRELGEFKMCGVGADEQDVLEAIMRDMEQQYIEYASEYNKDNPKDYALKLIGYARDKLLTFDYGELIKARRGKDDFLRDPSSRRYDVQAFTQYLKEEQNIDLEPRVIAHEEFVKSAEYLGHRFH